MTAEQRKQYGREWMLERAAILEYEGGWPREQAEALAVVEWRKLCAHDPQLQDAA